MLSKEQAWRVHKGLEQMPPGVSLNQIMQNAMGGYIDEHGDLWCLNCNNPNECCNCDSVTDDALHDTPDEYMLDDTGWDFDQEEYVEVVEGVKVDGASIPVDEINFCEKCGRSFELCDCYTKEELENGIG